MLYVDPTTPNLPDFTVFVYNVMQVPAGALPSDSPYLVRAFYRGLGLVISALGPSPYDYTDAVYNCGGHILICSAQDQPSVVGVPTPPFFATARAGYGTENFVAGVVSGAGDNGTSDTLLVSDFFSGLTLTDLGLLKTPYGRAALEYNQSYGGLFGMT